jgi:hypothetical protein
VRGEGFGQKKVATNMLAHHMRWRGRAAAGNCRSRHKRRSRGLFRSDVAAQWSAAAAVSVNCPRRYFFGLI